MRENNGSPKVSVLIVTYNSGDEIAECLKSLLASTGICLEVIVVDNASTDNTCEIVSRFGAVLLIPNLLNYGFPKANNLGIAKSSGDFILLLNPDTIVPSNSVSKLVGYLQAHPRCGIVGPQLVDGSGVHAPDLIPLRPLPLPLNYLRKPRSLGTVECVSGAAMLFRKSLVEKIGFLDETLFWCEDADYCQRASLNGYSVDIDRSSKIVHLGQRSGNRNKAIMIEKSYTSKVGYLTKYYSVFWVKSSIVMFLVEILLRLTKWLLFWFLAKHRVEAIERIEIYLSVSRILISRLCA